MGPVGRRPNEGDPSSDVATGKRHPYRAKAKRAEYIAARVLTLRRAAPAPDFLWFHPAVATAAELADLSARLRWYMPHLQIPVYVEGARSFVVDDAPYMAPEYVTDPGWCEARPSGSALHVYWRLGLREWPSFVARSRNAEVVAHDLFVTTDSRGWAELALSYGGVTSPPGSAGLERLLKHRVEGGKALVLGTGPSAKLLDPDRVDADVRIVCNSAVRDLDLIRALDPHVIAFYDPVFHFGPSRYAAAFRADLVRALAICDAEVVTVERFAHVLLAHHPEIRSRVTVIGGGPRVPWHWPTPAEPWTRQATNVLVSLLLPVGFTLADTVEVAGCDGRRPSENYFWKHNQQIQYSDELMRTVFTAHPAFFANIDYPSFYARHCAELEEVLALAESEGKRVVPVTPSWIPALASRGASSPEEVAAG